MSWSSFLKQSNFSQDGSVAFVAGSGMIAKLDAQGKVLKSITAPNLADDPETKKKMEEAAKKQAEQVLASYELQVERLEKQVKALNDQVAKAEEKEDERALKRAKARLEVAESQLTNMQELAKQFKDTYAQQLPSPIRWSAPSELRPWPSPNAMSSSPCQPCKVMATCCGA